MANLNQDYYKKLIIPVDPITGTTLNTLIPYTASAVPSSSDTVVGVNAIELAPSSSSVSNYYVGYDIILKKVLANGRTYTQRKRIAAYSGTTKVALIEDVWDIGYEPDVGDTYSIVLSYQDHRVSINTPIQVADYICSDRYGRGFNAEKDLVLSTWLSAARIADSKSDVSLKVTDTSSAAPGAVYRLTESGKIIWEGTIREAYTNKYPAFTKVLGKITNKWNSWKSYELGDIVYSGAKFYRVTSAGVKSVEPTHPSGTANGLLHISALTVTKASGTGPTTLTLDLSKNPVIALNDRGEEISGYSLYDADSIDYWRRLGWDQHSQSSATLYQTNFTIDTSAPLFDNINMMLEHCKGIFSYSEGRYSLDLETSESEFVFINEDDIIGKISFEDAGAKSAVNSITVSYIDPANNFEARNISLFNDVFLKQDRGVQKKGNISVVGMTNYYNVRLLADSHLKKSRFNTTINLTLFPEFITLVTGSTIALTYKRFGWLDKKFRVDSLTLNEDSTISIVASEYQDSFYALTNLSKTAGVGQSGFTSITAIPSPTNVRATSTTNNNELKDGIIVSWTNAPGLNSSVFTEIYVSDIPSSPLTITTIASNQATFSTAHGLIAGSKLTALVSSNGIIKDSTYYVKEIINSTTVTLSTELNGTVLSLTAGTGKSITMNTFTMVGSVSYPENTFIHNFPNIIGNTAKYYKVRYRTER